MLDFIVIGAGIVGLSTARALQAQHPNARVLILEKETGVAMHQTGHNSGVIHSGIYYKPGSLKARLALEGSRAMVQFCKQHGILHNICGKVIVATKKCELPGLNDLHARGVAHGLSVYRLNSGELHDVEPHVRGVAALYLPMTGIVNYAQVCAVLSDLIRRNGGDIRLGIAVTGLQEKRDAVYVQTHEGAFASQMVINCTGLHSDRVARLAKVSTGVRIVPFRGEYYALKPHKRYLVRNLVYPVPNPNFPFLGVHFTRMMDGHVEAGPNAVLSFKREGYRKRDVNVRDLAEVIGYGGFWRLAAKYWRNGASEMYRSISKSAFVRNLQQLIPEIQVDDLEPAPAGVRAQALKADGTLVDDFYILRGKRTIHICNAPSPAATASLKIGEYIAREVLRENAYSGLRFSAAADTF